METAIYAAGNVHWDIGRAIKASASEDLRLQRGNGRNSLECDRDVIQIVMQFLGVGGFLFVAGVSTQWRGAWGHRPTVTSIKLAVQSLSCFAWARACGLDIYDGPCLHAAAEGRLDVLQYAAALGYAREGMLICEYAAGGGHLEVVKWCRANGYPWGRSCVRAAEGGHSDVLQWWVANGCLVHVGTLKAMVVGTRHETSSTHTWKTQCSARTRPHDLARAEKMWKLGNIGWSFEKHYPWPEEACYVATKGGHFKLLMWLRSNGCPWSPNTMQGAVEAGNLEMLQWCRANGCPWVESIWKTAFEGGNLEVVQWCIAHGPGNPLSFLTCFFVVAEGHLEVLQWLRARGYPWGYGVCYAAASGGHFEVLKWCVANGCPWGGTLSSLQRGFKGTLSMMLWATANGCPWMHVESDINNIRRQAAARGNIEVLQWCGNYITLQDPKVWLRAALNGRVHVLHWLRTNDIVSDESNSGWLRATGTSSDEDIYSYLCDMAATAGSLETVQWCRANGYPWNESTCAAAAGSGNLELLRWCRANGCPWDEGTCERAAGSGNLKLLQWCRANGCPWNEETCARAAARGDLEMLVWCRMNGCPWDMSTLVAAARQRNIEVVEWCVLHHGKMTTGRRFRALETEHML